MSTRPPATIREQPFALLDRAGARQYGDVEHEHEMSCSLEPAASATGARLRARLRAFQVLAPGAVITLRMHTYVCRSCNARATRVGILVAVTVAEGLTQREYAG